MTRHAAAARDDAHVQGGRLQAAAGGELADQLPVQFLPRRLRGRVARLPGGAATLHLRVVDQQVDRAGVEVDTQYVVGLQQRQACLLYTSPSPRDQRGSRMPSSA